MSIIINRIIVIIHYPLDFITKQINKKSRKKKSHEKKKKSTPHRELSRHQLITRKPNILTRGRARVKKKKYPELARDVVYTDKRKGCATREHPLLGKTF